jgi:hypothetical protein
MTENICRYTGDREQAIVAYLYDDASVDLAERVAFDAHLVGCARCCAELAAFKDVRASLGRWSPPEPAHLRSQDPLPLGAATQPAAEPASRSWWREIPAWAQVAAAMLCLGAAAAIANLDVRYDATGLQVRTGWSTPVSAPAQANPRTDAVLRDEAPWRAELTALEQRLRADLRPSSTTAAAATPATASSNDTLRRVRALVEESERRQQRELALRLAEAVSEVNAQRQADLVRIDRNIGAMQSNTGREMLRQRNEMLNYVSLRTASQRPQ